MWSSIRNLFLGSALALTAISVAPRSGEASVPLSARTMSIDVKDADLKNLLRFVADTGHVNIVIPDHVSGKVTVKLRNVAWQEAFDVILAARDLGYEKDGNVIFVDTLTAMAERQASIARRAEAQEKLAELVTVVIPVSYASATDLAKTVRTTLTPRGSISVDVRTNSLLVTDVARNADRVRAHFGGRTLD